MSTQKQLEIFGKFSPEARSLSANAEFRMLLSNVCYLAENIILPPTLAAFLTTYNTILVHISNDRAADVDRLCEELAATLSVAADEHKKIKQEAADVLDIYTNIISRDMAVQIFIRSVPQITEDISLITFGEIVSKINQMHREFDEIEKSWVEISAKSVQLCDHLVENIQTRSCLRRQFLRNFKSVTFLPCDDLALQNLVDYVTMCIAANIPSKVSPELFKFIGTFIELFYRGEEQTCGELYETICSPAFIRVMREAIGTSIAVDIISTLLPQKTDAGVNDARKRMISAINDIIAGLT